MKPKLLLALSLFMALSAGASAQLVDPERARQSTRILEQMRKVELLNQILPLTLERNQILAILPSLERVRDRVRKLYVQENADLQAFDKQTQQMVDAGLKGKLPDDEYVRKMIAFYKVNDLRRQVAINENIDLVQPILDKTLHKGQLKVMENSLSLAFFEPDVKPSEVDSKFKQRVFIREVLLDPLAYDLLVQMSK